MSKSKKRNKRLNKLLKNRKALIGGGVAVLLMLCMCSFLALTVGQAIVDAIFQRDPVVVTEEPAFEPWAEDSAELRIAVSSIMAPTLQERVERFNDQGLTTQDGQTMQVTLITETPEEMVRQSLGQPPFQALVPDSSLWLGQIERQWSGSQLENNAAGVIRPLRISESTRFAMSPIVLAAWEDVARDLGWPNQPVGWEGIQAKATVDPDFKWNHPNTQHAAGMLATLAEFYAGAGITRGLTEEIATQQSVLDYVRDVEATVRFYGEGEDVILQRLAAEGREFLDLFVAQEQTVIRWNEGARGNRDRLVAIYPSEGTLWVDHPLALLELSGRGELTVTDNQRRTYRSFVEFLLNQDSQMAFLLSGYRPADLSIEMDSLGSPFVSNADAVDFQQPQTTLQIPSPGVVEVVQNVWWYTKRPTNVYLVVDTSGSMDGQKMESTRTALQSFISQIQGDRDQVGVVEFGSGIKDFQPLRTMSSEGRLEMISIVTDMEATGNTALIDGIWQALDDLQMVNDQEAINAIVVMTDGQENDSRVSMGQLRQSLENSNVPVVVFTIAFGRDADDGLLEDIARMGDGQFRRADETDIEELYRIISTYF